MVIKRKYKLKDILPLYPLVGNKSQQQKLSTSSYTLNSANVLLQTTFINISTFFDFLMFRYTFYSIFQFSFLVSTYLRKICTLFEKQSSKDIHNNPRMPPDKDVQLFLFHFISFFTFIPFFIVFFIVIPKKNCLSHCLKAGQQKYPQ